MKRRWVGPLMVAFHCLAYGCSDTAEGQNTLDEDETVGQTSGAPEQTNGTHQGSSTDADESTAPPFVDPQGECIRAVGRRVDDGCVTWSEAYCVQNGICERRDHFVISPLGECWHLEHDCGVPPGWSTSDEPCVDGARQFDYCTGGEPNFASLPAGDPAVNQETCEGLHPAQCISEGCHYILARRVDIDRECAVWAGLVGCYWPDYDACHKLNDAGKLVPALDPDGACHFAKVSCLPESWEIATTGPCAEFVSRRGFVEPCE